jgi:uncharacterized membrane protein YidH (DUF202 family)
VSVAAHLEWRRDQRALRLSQPLPSPLPRILAVSISGIAVLATVVMLLSAALR